MKLGKKNRLRILALLVILCLLPLGAVSSAETGLGLPSSAQEGTITAGCTITLPQEISDKSYRITDDLVETYQIFPAGSEMTIQFAEAAQAVYLQWYAQPGDYTFEQYDASGALLSTDTTLPFYNCLYAVTDATRSIKITFNSEQSLSGVFVYAQGASLPENLQAWTSAPEKADLLIIGATVDTTLAEFGSVIASYTVEHEVSTAIVVLSDDTRTNVQEFLDALWMMGVRNQPIFADYHCNNNEIYKTVNAQWRKKTVTKYVTGLIETYVPTVIVTHPDSEDASIAAAQFTGEQVLACAKKAKIAKVYKSSASGATTLPDDALISIEGRTVTEAVQNAYTACCLSKLQFTPSITPNMGFDLLYTSLDGADSGSNLFDNIDTASLVSYTVPEPTPEPTPEATPEPTPEPTPEQTAVPAEAAAPEQTTKAKITVPLSVLTRILPTMGIGIVLTILSFLILHDRIYRKYRRKRRRRKGKKIARLVGFAPLLAAIVVSAVFLVLGIRKEEVNITLPGQAAAVAEPGADTIPAEETLVDEPVSENEEAPDASDETDAEALPEGDAAAVANEAEVTSADAGAASEARTPTDADQYFRTASDPAEVFSADYDTGKWDYKSDVLSIQIDRRETTNAKGPVVYFVAHIRMRDVNTFRTTLSDADNKGDGLQKPWIVSRRNKAVLLITGDNLVHMDTEYKGIMIRRGRVYQDKPGNATETMAILPDLSMQTYPRRSTTASELLQDGIREAFSFGPTLVRGGEVQQNIEISRLKMINPRTGIGMVEPGHFVAIVVDGRQADYSVGMLLPEFAELFKAEGCTEAYNLDGGVSTCMIFMGEQVNHHGVRQKNDNADDTYQRRIPDALIWGYSEQVPSEDDPVTYTGELPG